jgi:hypothetical protein
MTAKRLETGAWNFEFTMDASVPSFAVVDRYRAQATAGLCSEAFEKSAQHGKRKRTEELRFDQAGKKVARRTLPDGGKTEMAAPGCAKDALTFLYFVRSELAAGRIAPAQTVYWGAGYQVKLEYAGAGPLVLGGARVEADRLTGTIKGPASEHKVELWFARTGARELLQVKLPLQMGLFSLELVR